MNNSTVAMKICTARMRMKKQEQTARAHALKRFNRENQRRIAGGMITLIILVIANLWAAASGWGLQ